MSNQVHALATNGKSAASNPKSILFVDDDADDRDVFGTVLKEVHPDFEYIYAKDGMDALHVLANNPPPICIYIDVNMPKMNGVELLRALSLHHTYSKIPVFVLSAYFEAEDKEKFKRLGAVDYLKKPESYQAFVNLLRSCFDEHLKG